MILAMGVGMVQYEPLENSPQYNLHIKQTQTHFVM